MDEKYWETCKVKKCTLWKLENGIQGMVVYKHYTRWLNLCYHFFNLGLHGGISLKLEQNR